MNMLNHQIFADAANPISLDCGVSVTALGAKNVELRHALDAHQRSEFQCERCEDHAAAIRHNRAIKHVDDHIDVVRDMIAANRAKSSTDTAIQIVEALNLSDRLEGYLPEEISKEHKVASVYHAQQRILFSVLHYLVEVSEQDLGEVIPDLEHMLSISPWHLPDQFSDDNSGDTADA